MNVMNIVVWCCYTANFFAHSCGEFFYQSKHQQLQNSSNCNRKHMYVTTYTQHTHASIYKVLYNNHLNLSLPCQALVPEVSSVNTFYSGSVTTSFIVTEDSKLSPKSCAVVINEIFFPQYTTSYPDTNRNQQHCCSCHYCFRQHNHCNYECIISHTDDCHHC